ATRGDRAGRRGGDEPHRADVGAAGQGARDRRAGLLPATEAPLTHTTEVAMDDRGGERPTRGQWSTKKLDKAPRGVYRHPSGDWGVRYTCGAGHIHNERVGRVKQDAKDTCDKRRLRTKNEPGWCPRAEQQRERHRVQAEQAREKARITFKEY